MFSSLQADITSLWTFRDTLYDLITFSLVLEHIEKLEHIFQETAVALVPGGYVYLGELHPFKQYSGTKARFDTEACRQVVPCFTHHVSEFTQTAKRHGLEVIHLQEYFDNNDTSTLPRILTILFKKKS
ncbi:methyltransferase domain-containing protein [Rufibacter tibetensis]|uniref:methyltransferase domain-containing protein n=1 Tax=Rufibacter tibetensis TaxID=512763 RepID=UPI000ACD620B|nr:methyltransferase domain-containing protein [Rufibacter tibetensis]